MEEIKSKQKNIIFATLTFSEESLKKLEYDEKEPNKAPQKAICLFRKRWWKKYKTPLRHWLITVLPLRVMVLLVLSLLLKRTVW